MKARTCFVRIPEKLTAEYFDFGFNPGRYTMYWYGPSQRNPDMTIVEDLHGTITTVPKEWVKLI